MPEPTTPFQKWYTANKEAYNAKRKQRYKSDPEYRNKVLEGQRNARAASPRRQSPVPKVRVINGVELEVVRMGMVVDLTGRSEKTIRGWEDSGLIPKPTVDGKHRYYTHKQLGLLVQFSAFLEEVRYDRALRQAKVNVKSQELYAQWES